MTSLEVKEDGQIWLIPDCPKEPNYSEYFEFSCASVRRDYQKVIASAERILVSDQMGAAEILIKAGALVSMEANKPLLNQGIYRIPDLKWEVKEHGSCGHPCDDYTDVCQHSGCTWERRQVAVIIQEDEKNGMYEEPDIPHLHHNAPVIATFVQQREELTIPALKAFIEHELGGYKIVHIGHAHKVIDRQFIYESDMTNLAFELLQNYSITKRNPQVK